MASGRPVIAFNGGGAQETIIPGITGILFEDQTWESLVDAVLRFRTATFDPALIELHAEKFNTEKFQEQIKNYVDQALKDFNKQNLKLF